MMRYGFWTFPMSWSIERVVHAVLGPSIEAASAWLGVQASALRHRRQEEVFGALTARGNAAGVNADTQQVLTRTHAYLAARRD